MSELHTDALLSTLRYGYVGTGPHACDSCKVKEVCCPLHSGESVQSGQVESHHALYNYTQSCECVPIFMSSQ